MTANEATTGTAEPLRLRGAAPGYTVNDLDKSLAWWQDILGFKVTDRWEREGKLVGVEMMAGEALIMLGQDDWQKGRDRAKGEGIRLYFNTDQDIDQLAARIKAAGGTLTQEPKDQPWGSRDIALEDPDGYKITIGKDGKS